jgi:hypothetical protein
LGRQVCCHWQDLATSLDGHYAIVCLSGADSAFDLHDQRCGIAAYDVAESNQTRGSFPSEEWALKLLYLAPKNVRKRWQPTRDWKPSLNHQALLWGDRIEAAWRRPDFDQVEPAAGWQLLEKTKTSVTQNSGHYPDISVLPPVYSLKSCSTEPSASKQRIELVTPDNISNFLLQTAHPK